MISQNIIPGTIVIHQKYGLGVFKSWASVKK